MHTLDVTVASTNEIKAEEENVMQEPVCLEEVIEPIANINSYQKFLEMQQQQQ